MNGARKDLSLGKHGLAQAHDTTNRIRQYFPGNIIAFRYALISWPKSNRVVSHGVKSVAKIAKSRDDITTRSISRCSN